MDIGLPQQQNVRIGGHLSSTTGICPQSPPLDQPHLEHSHLSSGGEGPTETLLPQEAKARSPPSTPAVQLLSVNDR